jgi:hypothetical protein
MCIFEREKKNLRGLLGQDKWNKYQPCKIAADNTDKRIFADN